jgi:hypothetical protein
MSSDREDREQDWQQVALELNLETQWAHACSWLLAARLAKSVDEIRFAEDTYPTGFGSVLFLKMVKDGRTAELVMNRAGSIRGSGFAGNSINWDAPTILSMPWVWWTCMSPIGRARVLDELHRELGLKAAKGTLSSRQVIGMRLMAQILMANMGDTEQWSSDVDGQASPEVVPRVDEHKSELVCLRRGDLPKAWVHEGFLWVDGDKIDAYELYRGGESLASIAARVG